MSMGALVGTALIARVAEVVVGARWPRTWLATSLLGGAGLLAVALLTLSTGSVWEWRSAFAIGGTPVHLRLDALSAWFLALVGVVGAAGAAYSREYWADEYQGGSAARGRAWWSVLLLTMSLVLLNANGLHFLIAWEAFALSGFFLITLDRAHQETRRAGWLYLASSHAGTLGLLAFFVLLALRTGSWELGPMTNRPELAPLFWLALFGFGVKAGLMPLHVWLPPAHANAPSHVSAIFSGVALKLGIYGIMRFSGWLPLPAGAGAVVLGIGAASAVLGIVLGVAQNDLKRLLAYCSVENIGVILVGLGLAMFGSAHANAPWGRLALAGALLHVWNHGLFKSLLFFGAGSVLHATGTREISRLGGLWRAMPWTASLFALGAAAIATLPPLNGFVSEWLVYLGLLDAAASRQAVVAAAIPAVLALAIAGAVALAAFIKATGLVFLGAPRSPAGREAHECGPWMRGAMLATGGLCGLIALAPAVIWPPLAAAVATWQPAWSDATTPAPIVLLSRLNPALALALAAAGGLLWWRARSHGGRPAPTWDCGYAAPTARMQYTGGSFGQPLNGWFRVVLRPRQFLRRPRGPFPRIAQHAETVPDLVLDGALEPLGAVVLRAAAVVRRLQHGRLPDYILYLVAGLAGIAAIVVFGGKP